MALTVTTGAGVLTAQATTTSIPNPSSEQIAKALNCTSLGWPWHYTHDHCQVWINTDIPLDWVAVDKTNSGEMSQLYTSMHGPGTLSFKWCADINDLTKTDSTFKLIFDGKVAATCTRPINPGPNFATVTVDIPAGEHTLFWVLTGTSGWDYNSAYLDEVHFTPKFMSNQPTQTSVLADLATLRSTVNGMPNSAFYPGTKIALKAVIQVAALQVKLGWYDDAANTLQHQFVTSVDGCARLGKPNSSDLVRTCPAQSPLYDQASAILQELRVLAG